MICEHKSVKMDDGTKLHVQIHEGGHPVWIVGVHGIGEHLGRHSYLIKQFGYDFNIIQFDLRGHGKSEGKRGYVDSFSQYFEDLKAIIEFLFEEYRTQKYILFGHSMGAMICAGFLQNYTYKEIYPERVFLNAPPIGVPGLSGKLIKSIPRNLIEKTLELPLGFRLGKTFDSHKLSHDSRVYENYVQDPLVVLKPHIKLLLELALHSKKIFSRPLRPLCPAFATIGTQDVIVSVDDFNAYFNEIEKAFKVKQFEGAFHEVHNEIGRLSGPYLEYMKKVFWDSLYPTI